MYKVLDLFAGAGGMSKGFEQTKKYNIAVAIEKHPDAQLTYKKNHKDTIMLEDILDITDYEGFKREYGDFDVIIGGPPCQGFSNANRQKTTLINQNNNLVKKYIEVLENLQPSVFVLENVRMLKSKTHKFYLSRKDAIDSLNISINKEDLLLFKGVCPVSNIENIINNPILIQELILPDQLLKNLKHILKRSTIAEKRNLVLEKKGSSCIRAIQSLPKRSQTIPLDFKEFESQSFKSIINYIEGKISFDVVKDILEHYIELQQMLKAVKELNANEIILDNVMIDNIGVHVEVKSFSVISYIKEKLGKIYEIEDDILNSAWFGAPQLRERYIAMGLRKDVAQSTKTKLKLPEKKYTSENYRTVWDAIQDLEAIQPGYNVTDKPIDIVNEKFLDTNLTRSLRNADYLHNHTVTESREIALKRFASLKQGENFHSLAKILIENTYSNPSRTQNSIYFRLEYYRPSGTVTNVRKSMWIHPTINRAISIREAARLQTFPDDFIFMGTKDSQYQQVGNAVPPIMSNAIAEEIVKVLDINYKINNNLKKEIHFA